MAKQLRKNSCQTIFQFYSTTVRSNVQHIRRNQIIFFFHELLVVEIPTLCAGYIVSVHRMVMENRPVDPGSIQGSHRPISFMRIKHRTRANDFFVSVNNHIVGLVHKNHIINEIPGIE